MEDPQFSLQQGQKISLFPYSKHDKNNLSRKLREMTPGYNNNSDFSLKKIQQQRDECLKEYKQNNYKNDIQTQEQLKLLDPIYRLIFASDPKLRKFMSEIKKDLEKLGLALKYDLINNEDPEHSQYHLISKIFEIFESTSLVEDEDGYYNFKKQLAEYFAINNDEGALFNLQRLLIDVQSRRSAIMNSAILDEKDSSLQENRFEFGTFGHAQILLQNYSDSFEGSQRPNEIKFNFGYGEEQNQDESQIKKIFHGEKNYVKEFYDLFQAQLVKKSPEFWQFLLYDLLRDVCDKTLNNSALELKLMQMLDGNAEPVQYLINFRKDLVKYLYKQQFGKKTPELQAKQEAALMKEGGMMSNHQVLNVLQMDEKQVEDNLKETQKGKKSKTVEYDHNTNRLVKTNKEGYRMEDQFDEIDFIKMEQNQIQKKIPTLQKLDYPEYLLFRIDPITRLKVQEQELVAVKDLPKFAQIAFEGIKCLNIIQSTSFKTTFESDENVLLSAPTGAGKTNVALLAILREVAKHLDQNNQLVDPDFKMVYLSPMKALASEITDKFQQRLNPLGIKVKECTGDMQLTKTEMEETQLIITTPEKWDVITRKTNQVADQLQLLLIDEIHLLNDERGSVLECLVARTLQHIERAQRTIRLFGISATMPNYLDVAAFLHVKKEDVYFFDHRYRPVPLLQKFIGVKEPSLMKRGPRRTKKDVYNELAYDLAQAVLRHDKQVLIFVHSRKETTTTAQYILERAEKEGHSSQRNLRPLTKDKFHIPRIQDKLLSKQVPLGLGFHHAGMLRKDRNIVEKMFLDGNIRVLVATSTLAWGVNLPAYQVIIKGTDVYDPNKGGIQNLSVLDVQQMFGRAGRPQFDDNGEAILMTDHNKVGHYMGQLNNASFLESRLSHMLKEAINAEIVLGNITSQKEAFDWINHTFFSIRIRRNPYQYGCRVMDKVNKELIVEIHISEMIEECLKELDKLKLIRYDRNNGYLSSTELGRITSHYYIQCATMEGFCKAFGFYVSDEDHDKETFKKKLHEYKSDLDILKILAEAKEFENIKYRGEEYKELQNIFRYNWVLDEQLDLYVQDNVGNQDRNITNEMIIEQSDKIIALINGYLCRMQRFDNFSLVSDTQFIIQNAQRLLRCLLDMCMMKNMAFNTEIVLRWCKLLENRISPGESPLRQFCRENFQGYNSMKLRKENKEGFLSKDLVERLETKDVYIDQIKESSAEELSYLLDVKKVIATVVKKFSYYLPEIEVNYKLKPVAQTVLQMDVTIKPLWSYSPRWHSKNEVFWITVDNEEEILHKDSFTISAKQQYHKQEIDINFFLPFRDSKATYYRMTITSNSWIVDPEYQVQVDLRDVYIQGGKMNFTELLDLQPLPITVFKNPEFSSLYPMKYLNANQTQVFHALYHTNENVLVGSPTGSGKTMMSEFAVLKAFQDFPGTKVIYVAPMKAIAKERLDDWDRKFRPIAKKVLELTGDYTPDLESLMQADILVTTPEKWDGISRNWSNRAYVQKASLLIFDEIHLLGTDRGPVLEVIVSRMNLIASRTGKKCRMVGLSTAMANGQDVAEWFGVPKFYFFNFRPHIRPVPTTIYFDGFSEKAYCPRMQTMNKPAYNSIKKFSDGKPVIIFVSSRRQTRLTALDLISYTMHETGGESSRYVKCSQEELDQCISQVQDEYLIQTLTFGIGMHHAGLNQNDRRIVEQMFLEQKIQVLVATSTLAWGVNLPARLVIVKGTEFFDPKTKRYVDMPVTDILQMIGRAGRPQFDDKGIACVFVEQSKKNFYRQYLNDPFPIESALITQLHDHFNAEISNGTIQNKQQCMDWVTWTYFFRRLLKNPSFYGLDSADPKEVKKYLINLVDKSLKRLQDHGCIKIDEDEQFNLEPTFLGNLGAFYYIKHESIHYFNKKLSRDISIPDLLRLMAYAEEFSEVPLRHNEENLNEELSKLCPLKCNKKAMDSPNEKAYLLFQAHIFRLPLPIRDYLTDTKIIIDSSVRIIHALIDMAAEKQYLQTTLNLMLLMQMLVQGVWFDQTALINIPYLEGNNLEKLGFLYLCELVELHSKRKLEKFLQKLPELAKSKKKQQEVISAVKSIPNVRMRAKLNAFDADTMEVIDDNIKTADGIIQEGDEAMVVVDLFRENFEEPLRIQVQATSKIKDASWWLVVGNEHEDQVLGLKKIYFKKSVQKKIQVEVPENFQECPNLKVFLVSDSYLGLDQVINLPLKPSPKKSKKDNSSNKAVYL